MNSDRTISNAERERLEHPDGYEGQPAGYTRYWQPIEYLEHVRRVKESQMERGQK